MEGQQIIICEKCPKECTSKQAWASHIKTHGYVEAKWIKTGKAEVKILNLDTLGHQKLYVSVDGVAGGNKLLFSQEVEVKTTPPTNSSTTTTTRKKRAAPREEEEEEEEGDLQQAVQLVTRAQELLVRETRRREETSAAPLPKTSTKTKKRANKRAKKKQSQANELQCLEPQQLESPSSDLTNTNGTDDVAHAAVGEATAPVEAEATPGYQQSLMEVDQRPNAVQSTVDDDAHCDEISRIERMLLSADFIATPQRLRQVVIPVVIPVSALLLILVLFSIGYRSHRDAGVTPLARLKRQDQMGYVTDEECRAEFESRERALVDEIQRLTAQLELANAALRNRTTAVISDTGTGDDRQNVAHALLDPARWARLYQGHQDLMKAIDGLKDTYERRPCEEVGLNVQYALNDMVQLQDFNSTAGREVTQVDVEKRQRPTYIENVLQSSHRQPQADGHTRVWERWCRYQRYNLEMRTVKQTHAGALAEEDWRPVGSWINHDPLSCSVIESNHSIIFS